MKQNELHTPVGSKHKRKRVGRGVGSGHGTYSCRGLKGQKSRSGGGVHPLFEGGQNPLVKRLPYKRGFTNIFRTEYAIVNLDRLNIFPEGAEVTPEEMVSAGIVKGLKKPIKILGEGELEQRLVVKANKFSETARNKIEAVGGRAEVIV
ncbi:MAG: 50S ribosomal protein L15 [Chloroflexi bacterium CG07_land_8_20_14_0_80_51_10]|nr:MAG: 50S ribosomal protein L15 [Chloroflexi bacterium CG07_land_8_20_14_0_80_51_10]